MTTCICVTDDRFQVIRIDCPVHGATHRCEGCGEETFPEHFDETSKTFFHTRAEHDLGCDGSCRSCPVPVPCGPLRKIERDA